MFELTPVKKQLIKFTLIGMLAVLVDLGCYYTILTFLPEEQVTYIGNEALAKTISFLCGMVVTYSLNKLWTWKQKDRSNKRLVKFAGLYGFSLFLNVLTNSVLLFLLHEYKEILDLPYKYFIAFIGATCASAGVNFLGQKFWVFREPGQPHDEEDLFG